MDSELFDLNTRDVLGRKATIVCSGEVGEIIGVAIYKDAKTDFLLRYKSADGRAVESWWKVGALNLLT